ncbi:TPA: hypothetical protein ACXJNV_000577 [Clostridioides difficile]|uniref:hypothetical protein n=1 Tax=Clostridioides difficile TaxID=1496 RepID=UPI0002E47DF9|nr:hypothetical protein [Clostridioides difficile]MBY1383082.1 hypothetical protein [Clostridioides difficile]MCR1683237.1 hypothetical protein [Clostridioides difficile]GMK81715.1 hypothetical protein JSCD7_00820 [Clostridioides difficile]HBE8440697.1 hypothetical protein [Clostridioides difficile]HBE9331458.1 hypothetical protein [Clostridioides difficile]
MSITDLDKLKLNLQEEEYPYFTDEQLQLLLESNDNNILKASWRGCLLKGATDDEIKIGPIETKSSNSSYWLTLADIYKSDYLEEKSKNETTVTGYKTSMVRVDGR